MKKKDFKDLLKSIKQARKRKRNRRVTLDCRGVEPHGTGKISFDIVDGMLKETDYLPD